MVQYRTLASIVISIQGPALTNDAVDTTLRASSLRSASWVQNTRPFLISVLGKKCWQTFTSGVANCRNLYAVNPGPLSPKSPINIVAPTISKSSERINSLMRKLQLKRWKCTKFISEC